ncbi:MAG: hypothetical protein QOD58_802 [Mycobacterium sp.]|nr:hypothetical protein [Mycobacterium sp.]
MGITDKVKNAAEDAAWPAADYGGRPFFLANA